MIIWTSLSAVQERLLTHWGRATHICVGKLTIIGLDNGLSPGRRQAIIWTNAGILLIGPLGTNFSENLIKILTFSFQKMRLKVSSAKRRPFCLGLNVLNLITHSSHPLLNSLRQNNVQWRPFIARFIIVNIFICCPLNLQKTPHTSPFRASYGVSFMSTWTEIDRVIKGFYCICVSELGHHWFKIMACHLFGAKPPSEPMLKYC